MKQEDTKQRILDKALELFSAHGYDSVSVGEIAKAVGIKAPSLYNHFPGKHAIFDAIVESTCKRIFRFSPRSLRMRFLKRCGRSLIILSIMKASAGFAA